tara:strand:- start:292 stop:471 length:180 start_codon:yes stop_codon:yes gene_type:complete
MTTSPIDHSLTFNYAFYAVAILNANERLQKNSIRVSSDKSENAEKQQDGIQKISTQTDD